MNLDLKFSSSVTPATFQEFNSHGDYVYCFIQCIYGTFPSFQKVLSKAECVAHWYNARLAGERLWVQSPAQEQKREGGKILLDRIVLENNVREYLQDTGIGKNCFKGCEN